MTGDARQDFTVKYVRSLEKIVTAAKRVVEMRAKKVVNVGYIYDGFVDAMAALEKAVEELDEGE